jgi:hypothetical protein
MRGFVHRRPTFDAGFFLQKTGANSFEAVCAGVLKVLVPEDSLALCCGLPPQGPAAL